ncbi:MAG: ribosome biogenesis GTPase Der [Verrucomicrobia bacterium]|nr:ribosome biogenesis GTPase Der [Verrucomicrobiota bacterium]
MNNVAIVGRPNVGKSALFNRLAKRRIAIVHDQPGITRDRISANVEANGKTFTLWDTGGIIGAGETELSAEVRAAAERAMSESALVLFVVDAQDGLNPLDRELARFVRKLRKPVLLVANKIDDAKHEDLANEFAALGFEHVFSISAAHGRGIGELTDAIATRLPAVSQLSTFNSQPLRLAVVGRPNAGKSSLINALLSQPRTIVSEIPGTTRDAVDIEYGREGKRYVFIDTAGIRARSKHSSSVEVFSVMRAEKTIQRADLCLLVVDASDGVRAQDRRIAGLIQKANKPCIVVLNKWDLVAQRGRQQTPRYSDRSALKPRNAVARGKGNITESLGFARDDRRSDRNERKKTMENIIATARAELFFLHYAPVLVTSALTGEHAPRIFKLIAKVQGASHIHIGTGKLNRLLHFAIAANPPPMVSGKRLKVFYAAQAPAEIRAIPAPEFILFVNSPRLLTQPFERFLEARIREAEPYPGLPLLLTLRKRE